MTPDWLYKRSTITKPFTVYRKYLEILAGGKTHERTIQAELIAPNILTATDSVSVTLTIAMDTAFADSGDHDPTFGISDGTSFVGYYLVDKDSYGHAVPCYSHEGDIIDNTLHNRISDHTGKTVNSRHFSSMATIQIKPNDQWGSCHTEHDEGKVRIANYQHKLNLTKGLYFEMYRNNVAEKYHIEYITAQVYLD